jgi:hypothetical protein
MPSSHIYIYEKITSFSDFVPPCRYYLRKEFLKKIIFFHLIFIFLQTVNLCEFHGIVRQGAHLNLVNIKSMFYVENRTGGWGFVVRDQTSTARESGARALPQVSSAAMSEIIACCQGCSGMGYTTRVTIESD